MNIAAIIQARMSSSRLPGKVKKDLVGYPILWHVIQRAKKIKPLSQVIVATSTNSENDWIKDFCAQINIECFRGSEDDVLSRFYNTAKKINADVIIRITADCPLLDPNISSKVVREFLKRNADIGGLDGEFPHGYDPEVFTFLALQEAYENSHLPSDREHVTKYFFDHPNTFSFSSTKYKNTISNLTLALDQEEDYILLSNIFRKLFHKNKYFGIRSVEHLLTTHPDLITSENIRDGSKTGLQKSLAADTTFLKEFK